MGMAGCVNFCIKIIAVQIHQFRAELLHHDRMQSRGIPQPPIPLRIRPLPITRGGEFGEGGGSFLSEFISFFSGLG